MNKKIVSLAVLFGVLATLVAPNVGLARTVSQSSQIGTVNKTAYRNSWEYISSHYTVKCYSIDGTKYQSLCKYHPKNFVFFQLMNLYIKNGGYYDWSSASHKRYIPTEDVKLYDRVSPEIIFKKAEIWSGTKTHLNYYIILNDKDSYLKSFNISVKTPDSDEFVAINPNNGTYKQYVLPNNLYGGSLDYYSITDVAFTSMKSYNPENGMFLEDTKSAAFWTGIGINDTDFINFGSEDDLKNSLLKIVVTDKKGNTSNVTLKISDILDAQN